MRVFIANFGQENYEGGGGLERGTVATIMNAVDVQPLWEQGKTGRIHLVEYAGQNRRWSNANTTGCGSLV